jgi:N4-(beta-N-acetylglucosaminyl)-L-asparaginase
MTDRRTFIRLSALAAGTLVTSGVKAFESPVPEKTKKPLRPVVLSTWNFGTKANAEAWKTLETGGRALDAVENGVKVIEADPEERSVGYGGRPDRDGHVTLDACIMDEQSNIGSVACLEHIVHAVSVARAIMEKTPHVMLVGEGALEFALQQGFTKTNLLTKESEEEWKDWLKHSQYKPIINIENHDTIGMIALDKNSNLSGACTTSGMAFKMHGRVGDSPIIGAGLYVDNEVGAATATGQGEEVIRVVGSHLVVQLMRLGRSPQKACEEAVKQIHKKFELRKADMSTAQIGFLALNHLGEYGAYSLKKGFTYAVRTEKGEQLLEAAYLME